MVRTLKLDQEEKEILEAYESGDLKSVKGFKKESRLIRQAAANTLRRDRKVSIRIANRDLEGIRAKAAQEGIPYQTLIANILHKFVSGRLVTR